MLTAHGFVDYVLKDKTVQSINTRNIGVVKQILTMPNGPLQIGVFWQKPDNVYWNDLDSLIIINESKPEYI